MAEAVINATVQVLVEKLIGVATQEFSLILGFKNELKRLKKSLEMTQAFLHDASKRQLEDEAVKLWLKNLEDVAYDADNLLDEFNYEIIRLKVDDIESQILKPKKVCFFFTCNSTPLGFRSKMAHKIKHVNMKLKMVNEEASSHGLQKIVSDSALSLPLVMETDSRSIDPLVIGRENDVSKIVNEFYESRNEVISVIPIVGMGGLGKTTLARLIFNEERTLKQFDERIWVCVSENFDTTILLKRILESVTKMNVMLESKEAIVNNLHEKLGGKRYLLVLDDLWNDNRKQWDDFKKSLRGINNKIGNYILVTTRRKDMASIVNSETNYVLGSLLDTDCWSIIMGRTFPNSEVPKEFETIGLEIARKCKGLPLAANMIGGTLQGKGLGDWASVLESGFSDTNTNEEEVLQVLKVSFDRLPSLLLKKCFAYCSVFKKDEKLKIERLVQLWMAEGFLIEDDENDMERVGDRVFDALLHSSFFLEVEEEDFLGIKSYKMHDLVHDLACLVSKTESFNAENHIPDRIPRVRYLAMKSLHEGVQNIMKDESLYLRTLFLGNNVPDNMYQDLKHLRVLDMSESKIEEVTASIDKLTHLRLLDVSSTNITALPESICKLYHLQTLNIIDCFSLRELPNQFHHLVSLRHLISKGMIKMPLEIGKLTCLRTLTFFEVGREKGLQIQELQYLKNLKGQIYITHLELVNGKDEAVKANLIEKPNIQELGLFWNVQLEGEENNHEKVLEGLQPHPNIKSLYINGFNGDKFPRWTMKMTSINELKLKNLIEIILYDCMRCQEIPTLGHLPLLERLELQRLGSLKSIGPSFYHSHDCSHSSMGTTIFFPALKSFKIMNSIQLEEWVGPAEEESLATTFSIRSFPRLEELDIIGCWTMIKAPSNDFPFLKKLRVDSMNSYHVLARLSSNKLTSLVDLSICSILDLGLINEMAFHKKSCLENLHVESCSNLKHLALSDDVCKLKSLTIWRCDNLSSISYSTPQSQGLSCLKILRIEYCSLLSIFPINEMLESCSSLEDLSIRECHNLTSLPIDFTRMPNLSIVSIDVLPKLTILPKGFGSLAMLQRLEIGGFSKDESGFTLFAEILQDIQRLRNLDYLLLQGWPQWESLPDQLQHLAALNSLKIKGFGIQGFPEWIWSMSSLQSIFVTDCEKLMRTPSEESIRCLPKLEIFSINFCPLIQNMTWTKIS